jgi:hypothetical protein
MMLDDMYGDVLEFGIGKILKGEHPAYAILNQGDDAVILSKTVEVARNITSLLNSGDASPYIDLEVEKHLSFLGMVVIGNGTGYRAVSNIVSMLVNFICAEHPVGHPYDRHGHRKHWALGVESWPEVYSDAPEYRKVRRIFDEVMVKHYGATITQIAKPFARLSREVLKVGNLSMDEARFLDKPERRFYSIDMTKVRSEITADVIRTISPDEIYQRSSRYIRPNYL